MWFEKYPLDDNNVTLYNTGQNSVLDPCEREKADAAANLSNQERENITAAAQVSTNLSCLHSLYVNEGKG